MMIREPAVAGMFYPSAAAECQRSLDACFNARLEPPAIDGKIIGGVVPHAGWACSGRVTAAVVSTIANRRAPGTFVIFGAVHRRQGPKAAIFSRGRWDSPLGSIAIDDRLAERVAGYGDLIEDDPDAHGPEHSIEVQVPFIQRLFPDAKLLPIIVPPSSQSTEVGRAVGRALESYGDDVVMLASSDLTHYGRRYGFTPHGAGAEGLAWAKNVNDRRIIDLICDLDAEAMVPEAAAHRNACGSGAIAALISAAKVLGAERGVLLEHTTSGETVGLDADGNAVGYAGIVLTE